MKTRTSIKLSGNLLFLFLCLTSTCVRVFGQSKQFPEWVNPLIGTANTQTTSLWGSEGGTYPGAAAPFGFVQLTPETRNGDSKGYNYNDSSILYFSCINHPTGYPDGSSGEIHIMPVEEGKDIQQGKYSRTFSHADEQAVPGYYKVLFRDDGTKVEVTAAPHSGMFRFTFPPKTIPRIFLSDLGNIINISKNVLSGSKYHVIISFNKDYLEKQDVKEGCVLTFAPNEEGTNTLILRIGVSTVDFESTLNNLRFETEMLDFDQYRSINQQKWNNALSVISIEDTSAVNKTIFYTALYHSMLMPWVISDVMGRYLGADGVVHKAKGTNQYSGFSAWDTFRSLHPLLCLIAPDRQQDMVLSMLDNFEQSGTLPAGPMTGNHVIPIIVDTYLKGITKFDKSLAYNAMKSCISAASKSVDFSAYRQLGYVPASCSESVTKTVEFAYDDWALAQFAGKVMNDKIAYPLYLNRSFNYRNLFSPGVLALLPRLGNNLEFKPGNAGYKEGDQWSYSMFVPHNPRDLINFFGGDKDFAFHLDSALNKQLILFDNEPVLHVPYLFNYASRSDLTQKWARIIMKSHYTNSPSGLPGNDDHGAMSSWYVLSALGIYPICPGRPFYDFGSPIFKRAVINLQNGKKWIINSVNNSPDHFYVRSKMLNNESYRKTWVEHSTLLKGGEMTFVMDNTPALDPFMDTGAEKFSETTNLADFKLGMLNQSQKKVNTDQLFYVPFMLQNRGSKGTRVLRLYVDGKEYSRKNLLICENSAVVDSIGCRLYSPGIKMIHIENLPEYQIEVIQSKGKENHPIQVLELNSKRIFRKNTPVKYQCVVRNISGTRKKTTLPVSVDDSVYQEHVVTLDPGEIYKIESSLDKLTEGIHDLQIGSKTTQIKIFSENTDSKIIEINCKTGQNHGDTIPDRSGFKNDGVIRNKSFDHITSLSGIQTDSLHYAEFNDGEILKNLEDKITVMAWVKPLPGNDGLSDLITKGDFIALQTSGKNSLSWFAGGWGRGSCSSSLPENWVNTWHHIAGVAEGKNLRLYIDGDLSGSVTLDKPVNLSSHSRWMTGRNEEFPDQRFFNGFIDHFMIFAEPLTEAEIKEEMKKGEMKIKE